MKQIISIDKTVNGNWCRFQHLEAEYLNGPALRISTNQGNLDLTVDQLKVFTEVYNLWLLSLPKSENL